MQLGRRALLVGVGTAAALAGCTGSSETEEELEEIAADIEDHFDEAERSVDSGARNMEREEWGQCGADMEGAVDEINSAETEIERALRRAESADLMDEADALDFLLDFVEVLRSAVDELMMSCDEMREGNQQQAMTHVENAEEYVTKYEGMERDLERAFDELE